jgi:hypothetical protein
MRVVQNDWEVNQGEATSSRRLVCWCPTYYYGDEIQRIVVPAGSVSHWRAGIGGWFLNQVRKHTADDPLALLGELLL